MTPQLSPVQLSEIRERTLREVEKLPHTIGRYEIRGELGAGGMGIVYDAYDPSLDRQVALKVIHRDKLGSTADRSDVMARFEKEMRATSDIFHPNIVAILDAGIDEGPEGTQAYYVMERIDGDSLEQLLRKCGALTRSKTLEIVARVARGLQAAHDKDLVHRDLKPSNILLPDDGEPRIADFGLCRFRTELASLTDAGTILGSANYISPEQLRSEEVTGASDLFSLGAILVRILTGEEPYPAESIAAHFQRILTDDPDGLDQLDPDIRALVLQLVEKDPAKRPASAAVVAEQLEAMAGAPPTLSSAEGGRGGGEARSDRTGGPTGRSADSTPPRAGAGANRTLGLMAALVLVLVVAGGSFVRNQLVSLDMQAETQWKQVENQLARQNELIPPLVEITKKYTEYETQTLDKILAARRGYLQGGAGERPAAAGAVQQALDGLLVVAERYPNLKADSHYRALAFEIAGSKNRISVERMRYNEAVGELNGKLRQIPWAVFAGSLSPRAFFNPSSEQMADPSLDL